MAPRRSWTQASIETEIAPIVAELGRMPTRRELTDRGLGGAWSAMQRLGGIATWRRSLTALAAASPPAQAATAAPKTAALTATPSREHIATRAYFIAQQGGGDPVANWLAAERELLAA